MSIEKDNVQAFALSSERRSCCRIMFPVYRLQHEDRVVVGSEGTAKCADHGRRVFTMNCAQEIEIEEKDKGIVFESKPPAIGLRLRFVQVKRISDLADGDR